MTKAPSIAVLAPHQFLPPKNGGHWGCFDFCEFVGRKTDVYCICPSGNHPHKEVSFTVDNILPTSWRKYIDPKTIYVVYKQLKAHNVSKCVVIQPYQGLIGYIACRLSNVDFIVYAHNLEYKRFRSLGKWWSFLIYLLEGLVYRMSDLVLFVSEEELTTAKKTFGLDLHRCYYLPPVISESNGPPNASGNTVFQIIYFADFLYKPNRQCLHNILEKIVPLLNKVPNFPYELQIYGRGIPREYIQSYLHNRKSVKYGGFVDDLEVRVRQADVLLNPVLEGGGVQIKILKALVSGTTVISSETGARGIDKNVCGEKLIKIGDRDWDGYVSSLEYLKEKGVSRLPTPQSFYEAYYWGNNIPNLIDKITNINR